MAILGYFDFKIGKIDFGSSGPLGKILAQPTFPRGSAGGFLLAAEDFFVALDSFALALAFAMAQTSVYDSLLVSAIEIDYRS